jgi:hypothetical protein
MERTRAPVFYDARAAAWSGLLSGLIAGAVLALVLMIQAILQGASPWAGTRAIAAIFLGRDAMGEGFALVPVLVGSAAHFGLSLAFGLAFGLVAYPWQRATVLWASAVWGLMVYAFMAFLALPQAAPQMVAVELSFWQAFLHLVFGLVIGLSYEPLRFRLAKRRQVTPERVPPPGVPQPVSP